MKTKNGVVSGESLKKSAEGAMQTMQNLSGKRTESEEWKTKTKKKRFRKRNSYIRAMFCKKIRRRWRFLLTGKFMELPPLHKKSSRQDLFLYHRCPGPYVDGKGEKRIWMQSIRQFPRSVMCSGTTFCCSFW